MRLIGLLLLIAACSRRDSAPVVVALPTPDAGAAPAVRVPDSSLQLVTATVPAWDATTAELRLWTRPSSASPWLPAGPAWPATVGRTGIAWGRGLHGDGAPAGRDGPLKREGDGRSPAGLFAIGPAFGYAATPPAGARMPYTPVDASWNCVDDPASAFYNRVLDARTVTPDWKSAEDMRRADPLYAWVIEVRHNPSATPGGGSCIFLHVWADPTDTTVGCTAMEEPRLAALIAALDPASSPVFAQLTHADYDAVATTWGLPPR